MIRSFLLPLFICLAATITSAQPPNWTVNPFDFQYTMTVVGVASIECIESTDTSDVVAAFINGEVRGVQPLYTEVGGRFFAFLVVYDNDFTGNTVSFQIYDASADSVYEVIDSLTFEENDVIGEVDDAYVFSTEGCSSGIDEIQEGHVRFFPNPAGQTVFFNADKKLDLIRVYGLNGTLVCEIKDTTGSGTIDVSGWTPQVYRVWCMTDGVVQTQKLVVAR